MWKVTRFMKSIVPAIFLIAQLISLPLWSADLSSLEGNPVLEIGTKTEDGKPFMSSVFSRVESGEATETLSEWYSNWKKQWSDWNEATQVKFEVTFLSESGNSSFRRVKKDIQNWIQKNSVSTKEKSVKLDRNLSKRIQAAFRLQFPRVKGEDITMGLIRGPLVGGVTTFGLVISSVPLPSALLVGAGLGAGSGAVSLFMKYWEEFLNRSNRYGKYAEHWKLAKFGALEVAFLAVQPAVFLATGVIEWSHLTNWSFWGVFAGNVIGTTYTQGRWETGILRLKEQLQKVGRSTQILGKDMMALGAMAGSLTWVASAIAASAGEMIQSEALMKFGLGGYVVLFAGAQVVHMMSNWGIFTLKDFMKEARTRTSNKASHLSNWWRSNFQKAASGLFAFRCGQAIGAF